VSFTRKAAGGGFALALAVGAIAVGVPAAHAATAACGNACSSPYSEVFGPSQVFTVGPEIGFGTGPCGLTRIPGCGDAVSLQPATNSSSAQDFTPSNEGTVQQLAEAGLISAHLTLHYSTDSVFEFQYAPNGIGSGLCVGLPSASVGPWVELMQCGTTAATLWIVDTYDVGGSPVNGYTPLINGTVTSYSNPNVLTEVPGDGGGDAPVSNMIKTTTLSETAGVVVDTQMWAQQQGVLQ
jgi:hypothetical protein